MGVKFGISCWGKSVGWECLRIGCWGRYRKTHEVGHPFKLATLWGTSKFLWSFTWSLFHKLATYTSWILATVSRLVLCFMCKFNLLLTNLKGNIVFLFSVISRTTCSPLQLSFFYKYVQQIGISWWHLTHYYSLSPCILAGFVPAFQLDTSLCTLNCTFEQPIIVQFHFHSAT